MSENARTIVAAELEKVTGLFKAMIDGGVGSNTSTHIRGIASSGREDPQNLFRKVRRVTKRALEGLYTIEEAEDRTGVKEEDVVNLVAGGSPSSSALSTFQPPPHFPNGRFNTRALSAGKKGPITKKPRVE